MTRTTLVTIAVTGPYHRGDYHWQVDGPGGITSGFGATFAEARTAAGEAAVTVGAPRGARRWGTARRRPPRPTGVPMSITCPWCGHTLSVRANEISRTLCHPDLLAHLRKCPFAPTRKPQP